VRSLAKSPIYIDLWARPARWIKAPHRAAVAEALARVRENHPRWQNSSDAVPASARLTLADTQLVIAEYTKTC
jgi:hypothetical protein